MAIFYVRPLTGNDANDGLTPATAWRTLTSGATAARVNVVDTQIRIEKSPDPVSVGNATWTDGSSLVTLAAAQTVDIDDCGTVWTAAGTSTTQAEAAILKEGVQSLRINIGADGAGAKLAFRTLPGVVDASAHTHLSFWMRSAGQVAANVLRIDLCSDATGDVPVASLTVTGPLTNKWCHMLVTNGVALPNNIQSIAIRRLVVSGSATLYLDNILACSNPATTGLHLGSLIKKNLAGEEFYTIRSIKGTAVYLDRHADDVPNALLPAYPGATEAIDTLIRNPFRLPSALIQTANSDNISAWGTVNMLLGYRIEGSFEQISGGWDSTLMGTQTGETVIDLVSSQGAGMVNAGGGSAGRADVSKLEFAHVAIGFVMGGQGTLFQSCKAYGCNTRAFSFQTTGGLENGLTRGSDWVSVGSRFASMSVSNGAVRATGVKLIACATDATGAIDLLTDVGKVELNNLSVFDAYCVCIANRDLIIRRGESRKLRATVDFFYQKGFRLIVSDWLFQFNPPVTFSAGAATAGGLAQLHNVNRIANNHWVYSQGYTIQPDFAFFRTGDKSWRIFPSGNQCFEGSPVQFQLGPFWRAAGAGTIGVYVYRSSAGVSARLRIPGGQLCNPTADLTATDAGAAGAWNLISIPIVMPDNGPVEAVLEVWNSDGLFVDFCWTDDLL